jgi:hypothetical protein
MGTRVHNPATELCSEPREASSHIYTAFISDHF